MDRNEIVSYLGALDDTEWAALVADARGVDNTTDAKLRAAERSSDWQTSMALKAARLNQLLNGN